MKLINKFIIGYICITTFTLLIGGVILYREVLSELEHEARNRLGGWIKSTVEILERGDSDDALTNKNIEIKILSFNAPLVPRIVRDTTGVFPPRRRGLDRVLTISKSYKINGQHVLISASDFIAEPDEIFRGVRNSLLIVAGLLVLLITVMSLLISKRILAPFHYIINAIKQFQLKEQKPIIGRPTTTLEIRELNYFLENMSRKAIDDYRALKEFSENASHEIQTPLSIIRGKLELLMDAGVTESQSVHIHAIHDAVQRLSSVNHSLVLLTKLENQEYNAKERINLSVLVETLLQSFQELMDMKSITCTKNIQKDIEIPLSYPLAEILMNNLLGNAIRHNQVDGLINIQLSRQSLILRNSGRPLMVQPEDLFKRFKKGNQSANTTGLGLSIAKQICDLANMKIDYQYTDDLHTIEVTF